MGDDPVDNSDRSGSDRPYIRPGSVKQRANQPLELEPKCRRKPIGRLMGGSRFHEEEKRRAEAGSALLRAAGVTYRQVLASFRATTSQQLSSILRSHASTKSMLVSALPPAWLIRTFHYTLEGCRFYRADSNANTRKAFRVFRFVVHCLLFVVSQSVR